ncbi:nuclear transport factor 2 family protein [Novosphingobium sp. PASSN1]|uniref:nuclear transport factor 2 family protein n=1 Tax=Novosphingobium sp. PASSN1 TaxID=2015561 RepID=UPI000BCB86CF|nr:nuclear transport factor 2 family protein [Novosphingobium sp. PASSN1]OYU34730.1 MAG: hypothetical protein CFE35_12620 [Novosphingobium sp. PASSN1]
MTIDDTKRIVREWVRCWNAGEVDALAALYHDQRFSWRISGQSPVSRVYTKAEIIALIRTTFDKPMIQRHHIDVTSMTAEDNRVALEFIGQAVFADGTPFLNHYHALFFIEDGLIIQGRAYLDTWVASQSSLRLNGADSEKGV